jgi:hypothetical protein
VPAALVSSAKENPIEKEFPAIESAGSKLKNKVAKSCEAVISFAGNPKSVAPNCFVAGTEVGIQFVGKVPNVVEVKVTPVGSKSVKVALSIGKETLVDKLTSKSKVVVPGAMVILSIVTTGAAEADTTKPEIKNPTSKALNSSFFM